MKVIKIGGGSLKGKGNIQDILALVAERGPGHINVISALSRITDMLIDGMTEALRDDVAIPSIIRHIKNKHILVARHIIPMGKFYQKYTRDLTDHLRQLERLYYGLNFTKEITPRIADVISSFGQRLSADLLTCALRSRGLQAPYACLTRSDSSQTGNSAMRRPTYSKPLETFKRICFLCSGRE